MQSLLAALSLYYACDVIASHRPMDGKEVMFCASAYEAVKGHFAPETGETSVMRNQAAYLAFKSWESDNPELVEALQQQARVTLGYNDPIAIF